MMLKREILWMFFAAVLLGSTTYPSLADPLATFTVRDITGLDWQRTLVTYPVKFEPNEARENTVRLVDADGVERPCQFWRVEKHADGSIASARVSFFAELAANGSYTFQLVQGNAAPAKAPRVIRRRDYLQLENELTAIKLIPEGKTQFRNGQPLDAVPGPFAGIRLADDRWTGSSRFSGEHLPDVVELECRITERGPLFAEALVRYTYDNGGFYQFTARVITGDPAVRIDEQSDSIVTPPDSRLGNTYEVKNPLKDMWSWQIVFTLADAQDPQAWCPNAVYANDQPNVFGGRHGELDTAMRSHGMPANSAYSSRIFDYGGDQSKIADIDPWYLYHRNARWFGLVELAGLTDDAQPDAIPFLGIVTLHRGNWRGLFSGHTGELHANADKALTLNYPVLNTPHLWTMLDSGEFDPELPVSYRRRIWAMVAGPLQHAQQLQSFRDGDNISLDHYKEWIVDWEQDDTVSYPRLSFTAEHVEQWKDRLDEHPLGEHLGTFLEFNDAPARRDQLARVSPLRFAVDRLKQGTRASDTYRHAQYSGWVHQVDELLSSPALSVEQRHRIRQEAAVVCHLFAEPNFNPRGNGSHLGNPNMPINRTFPLIYAASLIPDHPKVDEWLNFAAEYVRYKQALLVAPTGTWGELISYYGASATTLQRGALMLKNAGLLTEAEVRRVAQPANLLLHLITPPDPRDGTRWLPGWGHDGSGKFVFDAWTPAAALMHDFDTEFVRAMTWAWEQQGRPISPHHDEGFGPRGAFFTDELKKVTDDYHPPQWKSVWLPGFGAVLRAHPGDQRETYMSYRQGYQVSHTDGNQGDFVLYAKGAPLVVMTNTGSVTLSGNELLKNFGWYNTLKFGTREKWKDWPGGSYLSQVHSHSFSDSVDYLRGMFDFDKQLWTRQILLLKGETPASPTYLVFRESVSGEPADLQQKWWSLRTLGGTGRVQAKPDGFNYTGPYGVNMEVTFVQPNKVRVESKDNGVDKLEDLITVNSAGPIAAGQNITVVLCPLVKGEPAPQYQSLAEGAARITTTESVDYIFANSHPFQFQQDGIAFSGIAGTVREYPDEIHLIIAEGPGEVSWHDVTLRSSIPATKVIPRNEAERGGEIEAPEPEHSISFALDARQGAVEQLQPGVQRQSLPNGFAYEFNREKFFEFQRDGVTFSGTRGGIVVDTERDTVRLVMLRGTKIGYGRREIHGGDGPYDLTYDGASVAGRTAGVGRFLFIRKPEQMEQLPKMVINGEPYAPGTSKTAALTTPWCPPDYIIVPVMPGENEVAIEPLPQPPVFRTWHLW